MPSGSLDAAASKVSFSLFGVELNAAVGNWLAASTLRSWLTVAVPPRLSVTVSVTGYVPAAAKVWVACTPVPVVVSPKSQAQLTSVPSGSLEAAALKVASRSVALELNSAVGNWFGGSTASTLCCTWLVAPWSSVTTRVTV